jgi:hypothetical protein
VCCLINRYAVEASHIDYQMTILPSKTMCSVAVASTFCSDFNAARDTARYSVLDLLDGLRYSVGGRYER